MPNTAPAMRPVRSITSVVGVPAIGTTAVKSRVMTELESLNLLFNDAVTDAGLKQVADLHSLRRLNLESTDISDQGLEHLAGLTKLLELDLSETKITDKGLGHLGKMSDLQVLRLSNTRTTDVGLGSLKVTTPAGILVTGDARLEVVPGGSITLSGGVVRVDGKLKAPSGSIELRTVLHRDAVISLPSEIVRLVPSIAGGVLAANSPAPMDLTTTEAIVIPAGKPLPIPFSYQRTRTLPGEALLDRTNLGGFTLEGPGPWKRLSAMSLRMTGSIPAIIRPQSGCRGRPSPPDTESSPLYFP